MAAVTQQRYSFLVSLLHPAQRMYADLIGDYHDLARPFILYGLAMAMLYCFTAGGRGVPKLVDTGVRAMVSVFVLDNYAAIFVKLAHVSDAMVNKIRAQAQYQLSLAQFLENAELFARESDSFTDTVIGLAKGTFLASTEMFSHWTVPAAAHAVNFATGLMLLIVFIFGPFMVAANVFEEGKYFNNWVFLLVNIFLWPVFANFVMLASGYIVNDFTVARDNVIAASTANALLAAATFVTPIFVAACLRHGGLIAAASFVWLMGLKAAASVVSSAAGNLIGSLPLPRAESAVSPQMAWRVFSPALPPGRTNFPRFDPDNGDRLFGAGPPQPQLPSGGGTNFSGTRRLPPLQPLPDGAELIIAPRRKRR